MQPTVFLGNNQIRLFQKEIFGPVLAVSTSNLIRSRLFADAEWLASEKGAVQTPLTKNAWQFIE